MAFNSGPGGLLTCCKNFECLFVARQVLGMEVPEIHDVLPQFLRQAIYIQNFYMEKFCLFTLFFGMLN